MSVTTKRLLVGAVALAALGLIALTGLLWLGSSLGCEDSEEAAFDTVQCDGERGRWWVRLQALLFLGAALGCLAGVVWGMVKPSLRPPGVALAVAVPALVATLAIQGIRVGDKAEPKMSGVRAAGCAAPCAGGVPVTFTLDRDAEVLFHLGPARFEDIGGRQYGSGAPGQPLELEAGTHTARVRGRIVNPPAERGPLPAGDYELDVEARPVNSGNQGDAERRSVRVVIR